MGKKYFRVGSRKIGRRASQSRPSFFAKLACIVLRGTVGSFTESALFTAVTGYRSWLSPLSGSKDICSEGRGCEHQLHSQWYATGWQPSVDDAPHGTEHGRQVNTHAPSGRTRRLSANCELLLYSFTYFCTFMFSTLLFNHLWKWIGHHEKSACRGISLSTVCQSRRLYLFSCVLSRLSDDQEGCGTRDRSIVNSRCCYTFCCW